MLDKKRILPLLVVLALASYVAGFTCGPSPFDPCEDDPHGCAEGENNGQFQVDPSCSVAEELDIEVGWGASAFQPIADGDTLEAVDGLQGGQHIFLGFRVGNPRLDEVDLVRARLSVEYAEDGCWEPVAGGGVEAGSEGSEGSGEGTGAACNVWPIGDRTLVVGGSQQPRLLDDGSIEEFGLVVFLDIWPRLDLTKRITLEVDDTCGRSASVVRYVR